MFAGRWRSADGAEIHLLQEGEAIAGTYTAGGGTMAVPCRGRVLVGTADGDVIGFVTSCAEPHMVRSWIGRLVRADVADAPEIHTVCHAVDRLTKDLDMARSVALTEAVFTRVSYLDGASNFEPSWRS